MGDTHVTAILLAAGRGTRMGGSLRKQYMELGGRPVLSHSLGVLENSPVITDIVLVIPAGEESYIRGHVAAAAREGAAEYTSRIRAFVPGGRERYDSVWNGLQAVDWPCDYVFIHDGARPFLSEAMLERLFLAVRRSGAAVAGMPSKDTVKLTDAEGRVLSTPDRSNTWVVQTPQCFAFDLVYDAYARLTETNDAARNPRDGRSNKDALHITDDAMVVETMTRHPVQMVRGDYRNIKITTPEDLLIGEAFLAR